LIDATLLHHANHTSGPSKKILKDASGAASPQGNEMERSPMVSPSTLASVSAELHFLDQAEGTPTNYFDVEPPAGTPRRFPRRRRAVSVHDARPIADHLSWEREGFMLRKDAAGVLSDFHDEALITGVYYPAVERIVKEATGARRVVIFDHTRRSSVETLRSAETATNAVLEAHNDYTRRSGPERVREMLARLAPDEPIDAAMARRYAVLNVWRPTNGVVEQLPLALCDMRSMDAADFVEAELRFPQRTGYVSAIRFNEKQRWFYAPEMRPDEIFVFTCYDSAGRDGHYFGAHTAFEDPTSRPDARPRESLEVRTIALF
jgi:hypothetical protein